MMIMSIITCFTSLDCMTDENQMFLLDTAQYHNLTHLLMGYVLLQRRMVLHVE